MKRQDAYEEVQRRFGRRGAVGWEGKGRTRLCKIYLAVDDEISDASVIATGRNWQEAIEAIPK